MMTYESTDAQRRMLLQSMVGVVAATQVGAVQGGPASSVPLANGRSGDFDFLTSNWKIANCRLVDNQWDAFEGKASVYAMLGGIASVEELRIPAHGFSGMGVRLLDRERRLWADHWIGGKAGVMDTAPGWGTFVDGSGRWDTQEGDVITRGVWDQITARSCRWRRMRSDDKGHTWTENWIMHWSRA